MSTDQHLLTDTLSRTDVKMVPIATHPSSSAPVPSHDVLKPTPISTAPPASGATFLAKGSHTSPISSSALTEPRSSLPVMKPQSNSDELERKKHRPSEPVQTSTHPKPYLATLPDHILDDIASYSDKQSLWALMAVCRSSRYAAAAAIKPHFVYETVTPRPRLSTDVFQPVDREVAGTPRTDALYNVLQGYGSFFVAYPEAVSLLRDLTVEVRSDDDEMSWDMIRRFAPQLHRLEVHVFDDRWDRPLKGKKVVGGDFAYLWDIEEEKEGREEEEEEEEQHDPNEVYDVGVAWPKWLFSASAAIFPQLTSLTIAATARTFAHFARLAPHLPVLRYLTLSAHETYDVALYFDQDDWSPFAKLPLLEQLIVSGNDENVARITRAVVGSSHLLRSIVVHISNIPWWSKYSIRAIAEGIMYCHRLVQLALYGRTARSILSEMVGMVLENGRIWWGPDLADLVLEFDRKTPILHPRPSMAKLQTLTFVDKWTGPKDGVTRSPRELVPNDFFDDADLRAAFRDCPMLKWVQWVIGWPQDPFGKTADHPPRAIACHVDRPGRGKPIRARVTEKGGE